MFMKGYLMEDHLCIWVRLVHDLDPKIINSIINIINQELFIGLSQK